MKLTTEQKDSMMSAIGTLEALLRQSFIEELCDTIVKRYELSQLHVDEKIDIHMWLEDQKLIDFISDGSPGERLLKNGEIFRDAKGFTMGGDLGWFPDHVEDELRKRFGGRFRCYGGKAYSDLATNGVETLSFNPTERKQ